MRQRSLTWLGAGALAGAMALTARPASALQPLDEFVSSARTRNVDNREAQVGAEQRVEEARQAWGKLAPSLTARASYTRNEYEAVVQPGGPNSTKITITPYDQLEANFTLTVPLVDVGSWQRIGAARATADAARVRAAASGVDVERAVTRAYFQVIATEATFASATKALATATESRALVNARREAGSASELDAERARAEVERARQVVASADQQRAVARRSLETLSGTAPTDGSMPLPDDGLGDEPALASLEAAALAQPQVRAAQAESRAADKSAGAAYAALYPSIVGSVNERLTNATGFTAKSSVWSVSVTATWNLDLSNYFGARAQSAAHAAAEVRERRVEQQAKDEVHSAYQEVRAGLARARAARAEAEASARAAKLARDRYQAGSATQLDVQQADRDAFASEVARIQAQADLAYARASIRLSTGRQKGAAPVVKEAAR